MDRDRSRRRRRVRRCRCPVPRYVNFDGFSAITRRTSGRSRCAAPYVNVDGSRVRNSTAAPRSARPRCRGPARVDDRGPVRRDRRRRRRAPGVPRPVADCRAPSTPSATLTANARPSGRAAANTPSAPSLAISPGTCGHQPGDVAVVSADQLGMSGHRRAHRLPTGRSPRTRGRGRRGDDVRRCAATVDTDVGDGRAELLDRRGDRQLQRMVDVEVVVDRPAVDAARGEHPGVLAGAVLLDRRRRSPPARRTSAWPPSARAGDGRVAERRLVETGVGEDPSAPQRRVHGVPSWLAQTSASRSSGSTRPQSSIASACNGFSDDRG